MTCCKYSAGMMRHQIEVKRQVRTPDEYGGVTATWETFKTLRAMIKPMRGSERWAYDRLEAIVTHKIVTRYTAGITSAKRIYYQGRAFRIESVINVDEDSKWLELVCEERDGDR
jgi:SPP1 family predicted phage head-tail adaptor